MSDTDIDHIAAKELQTVLKRIALHTPPEKLLLVCYYQSMMTQAANQVLVDLLRQHNIFPPTNMQKRLADKYREYAKDLENANMIAVQGKATLVLPN